MAERCGEWIRKKQIDELIPVPLHPSKKRSRGFNQSELLAKELGRILSIPVESDIVLRVKKTLPQKILGNREREENLQNAFGVRRSWSPQRTVLLIDDISDIVLRVKKTLPQKILGNREREENLQNAFGVRRSWSPQRTVLLIDDIYTTGNTIHRISKVLKQAGVQKVYFLTISIGQGL